MVAESVHPEVVADDPTGVEGIAADEPSGEKRIFDLLGRRRNAEAKGLVIVNGKLKINSTFGSY